MIDSIIFSEIRSKARSQLRVGLCWKFGKKWRGAKWPQKFKELPEQDDVAAFLERTQGLLEGLLTSPAQGHLSQLCRANALHTLAFFFL